MHVATMVSSSMATAMAGTVAGMARSTVPTVPTCSGADRAKNIQRKNAAPPN